MKDPNPRSPKTPPPCRPGLAEELKQQPAWLQEELEALRKHEATVLRALSNEENQRLFVRDPAGLLAKLKIPVSGALKRRLRSDETLGEVAQAPCVRLPNGQTLTPRIRFTFTKAEG